jgi:hypothetical protein
MVNKLGLTGKRQSPQAPSLHSPGTVTAKVDSGYLIVGVISNALYADFYCHNGIKEEFLMLEFFANS